MATMVGLGKILLAVLNGPTLKTPPMDAKISQISLAEAELILSQISLPWQPTTIQPVIRENKRKCFLMFLPYLRPVKSNRTELN